MDTDEVSIEGLRNLSAGFEAASGIAFQELEHYYHRKHELQREEYSRQGHGA